MWPRIVVYGFLTALSIRSVCSFLGILKRLCTLATTKSKLSRTPVGIVERAVS